MYVSSIMSCHSIVQRFDIRSISKLRKRELWPSCDNKFLLIFSFFYIVWTLQFNAILTYYMLYAWKKLSRPIFLGNASALDITNNIQSVMEIALGLPESDPLNIAWNHNNWICSWHSPGGHRDSLLNAFIGIFFSHWIFISKQKEEIVQLLSIHRLYGTIFI